VVHAPSSYARRFPFPKDRTFQATRTALATFGYTVTLADPERGTVKTAPKVHRLARISSSAAGDLAPVSHAFVISVQQDGAGHSIVTGYLRTFSAEHETTIVGRPNAPIVQEMWSRLFAEIASDL
jgi:hypothetical protein